MSDLTDAMGASAILREKPSPVLVTGAAGFVASHVVAQLAQAGADVIAVDIDGIPPSVAALWADHEERIRRVSCDVRCRAAMETVMEHFDPWAVVHAAAVTDATNQSDVERMHEINVRGSDIVLSSARDKRLVFVSSASVYQARCDDSTVYTEDSPVVVGDSGHSSASYATTKRAGELLTVEERERGSDFRVARVVACFGPAERPTSGRSGMSIGHRAVAVARAGYRPVVEHDATIDLTYVIDVARGIVVVLSADTTRDITNVSAGRPVRVTELAQVVMDEQRRRAGYGPETPARGISLSLGARRGVLDVGRLRDLEFRPAYTLARSVSSYFDWLDCHEH